MLRLLIVVLIGFVLAVVIGIACIRAGEAAGVSEGPLVAVFIAMLVGVPIILCFLVCRHSSRAKSDILVEMGFEPIERTQENNLPAPAKLITTQPSIRQKGPRFHSRIGEIEVTVFDCTSGLLVNVGTPALISLFLYGGLLWVMRPRMQTVVVCKMPRVILPAMFLCLRKEIRAWKYELPPCEEVMVMSPEFAGKYSLTGYDHEYIRRIFSKDIIDFLVHHKGLHIEAAGDTLTIYRPSREIPENAVKSTIEQYVRLAELFKESFRKTQRQ